MRNMFFDHDRKKSFYKGSDRNDIWILVAK